MVKFREEDPTFYIRYEDNVPTARFRLRKMPYCSAIVILCNLEVFPEYRGKGISKSIFEFVEDEAKRLRYSAVICTDVATNAPMRKCLSKHNWTDVFSTKNTNTGNMIYLTIKDLRSMNKRNTIVFLMAFISIVSIVSSLLLTI